MRQAFRFDQIINLAAKLLVSIEKRCDAVGAVQNVAADRRRRWLMMRVIHDP